MTSVIGHLTSLDFERRFRGWTSCSPGDLFEAPVRDSVAEVCWPSTYSCSTSFSQTKVKLKSDSVGFWKFRTSPVSQKTSRARRGALELYLSGPIVIGKEKISEQKSVIKHERAMRALKSSEPDSVILKERMSKPEMVHLEYNPKISRHILHAARNPIEIDDYQANAVSARIELDLRIGAAFTRLVTLQLQPMGGSLGEKRVISYGKYTAFLPFRGRVC